MYYFSRILRIGRERKEDKKYLSSLEDVLNCLENDINPLLQINFVCLPESKKYSFVTNVQMTNKAKDSNEKVLRIRNLKKGYSILRSQDIMDVLQKAGCVNIDEAQDHLDFVLARLNPSKDGLIMQQDFVRFGD